MPLEQRAGQTLALQVPAGDSGKLSVPVDGPATLESLKLRIYSGAENTLQLRPQKKSNGAYEDLLDYAENDTGTAKTYVDGDDDVWEWALSVPMNPDDEVVIDYENTDGSNAHNFRAVVEIDYLGGAERATRALKGVLA